MTDRETFEQWAAKQWGSDAWRHTSATSGEWEAFQAGCDMGRQAEPLGDPEWEPVGRSGVLWKFRRRDNEQQAEPPRTLTDAEIDYDGNPYTFERLAEWLDRKFNRHHEDEDRAGAMLLRLQANEIVRLREFLAIWIGDGSLQTFEHREKFRAAARAVLEVPNARLSGAGTASA